MSDYIELNHAAYDILADEYFARLVKYDDSYSLVGKKICEMIFDYIISENKVSTQNDITVLELGCGPGAILLALREYLRVKTFAIDFSERMAFFAHKCNEKTKIVTENILNIQDLNLYFDEDIQGKVDVIIMAAFIHLFPIKDAYDIMDRLKKWLSPNGIIYLDTTKELESCDGEIRVKELHHGKEIRHLRTLWTKDKFNNFLSDCGYIIVKQHEHIAKGTGKVWIRTIARPK